MTAFLWSFEELARLCGHQDRRVKGWAAGRMSRLYPKEAGPLMAGLLSDRNGSVAAQAAAYFCDDPDRNFADALLAAFRKSSGIAAKHLGHALALMKDGRLLDAVRDKHARIPGADPADFAGVLMNVAPPRNGRVAAVCGGRPAASRLVRRLQGDGRRRVFQRKHRGGHGHRKTAPLRLSQRRGRLRPGAPGRDREPRRGMVSGRGPRRQVRQGASLQGPRRRGGGVPGPPGPNRVRARRECHRKALEKAEIRRKSWKRRKGPPWRSSRRKGWSAARRPISAGRRGGMSRSFIAPPWPP